MSVVLSKLFVPRDLLEDGQLSEGELLVVLRKFSIEF